MAAHGGRPPSGATLAGLAMGGTMAGHWVAFALREPDAGARAVLLEATGHHLLPQLTTLALVAAATALLAVLLRGDGRRPPPPYGRVAARLAPLQAGGFLLLEAGERLAAHGGHGPATLHALLDPALLIGVAAQVVIGCALAALLVLAARLSPRRCPAVPAPTAPVRPLPLRSAALRPARPGRDALALRGPPVFSRP